MQWGALTPPNIAELETDVLRRFFLIKMWPVQLHYVKQPSWFTVRLGTAIRQQNLYGHERIGRTRKGRRNEGPRLLFHASSSSSSSSLSVSLSLFSFLLHASASRRRLPLSPLPRLAFLFLCVRVRKFCRGGEVRSPGRSAYDARPLLPTPARVAWNVMQILYESVTPRPVEYPDESERLIGSARWLNAKWRSSAEKRAYLCLAISLRFWNLVSFHAVWSTVNGTGNS